MVSTYSDATLTGCLRVISDATLTGCLRVISDATLTGCLRYSIRRNPYGLPSQLYMKATRKGCACVIWEGKPKGCVCKIVRLLLAIAFSCVNSESLFIALFRAGVALRYKS